MTGTAGRPVLVIIGPSACGKSSAAGELHRRGVIRVHPTWTTRPRRPDEVDGSLEHRFVTDETFNRLCTEGFFLETGAISGLPYRYGLPPVVVSTEGPIDAVLLRAPYVGPFTRWVPRCLVYQIEDSPRRARQRLEARGCDHHELAARLRDNERELAAGRPIADRVFVNDRPISALALAMAAVLALDVPSSGPYQHQAVLS